MPPRRGGVVLVAVLEADSVVSSEGDMRLPSVEESEDSATFVVSRDTSLERVLRLEGGLLVSRSRVPLVVLLSDSNLLLSPSDLVFSLVSRHVLEDLPDPRSRFPSRRRRTP
ncbi:hypothetical protein F511_30226 [Dorcoceras hygrometricum]|uniref:Uncharacterized protein n=1 Tax=Dorcoceras hygrometricum TaxID=472368 RepID=A0A2Z7B0U1_9LAMI|nr:hypothetical protein F511_30226 [Dorcoceras hygrometricum]